MGAASSAEATQLVYLNFDGATLVSGRDDATLDRTTLAPLAGEFAAYGEGSKREAVLQAVRADWARYDVAFTAARPAGGNYLMCMIGPSDAYPAGTLGIAPLDCGDENARNIAFAFHRADDTYSATSTATTISQEVAHTFGLEHVEDPTDIMHPVNAGGDPSFGDTCSPLSDAANCGSQHERHCDAGFQNGHQELLEALGPARPDAVEEGIELVAPADGERFDRAEDIVIMLGIDDGVAVTQAALFVDGELTGIDDSAPFGWTGAGLAEGEYDLYAEAIDPDGTLRVTPVVSIVVGPPSSPAQGSGALPGTYGVSRGEQGCSLGGAPPSTGWSGLGALFLLLAIRGRRRRSAP